jgi:hypothetical protein
MNVIDSHFSISLIKFYKTLENKLSGKFRVNNPETHTGTLGTKHTTKREIKR